jgi:hypothetical protein
MMRKDLFHLVIIVESMTLIEPPISLSGIMALSGEGLMSIIDYGASIRKIASR